MKDKQVKFINKNINQIKSVKYKKMTQQMATIAHGYDYDI